MTKEFGLALITGFLLTAFALEPINAQEIDQLNNFKHVIVETLIDEDMDVDEYQISSMVRKSFIEKGFVVVNQNKQSWPSELFNDPCLFYQLSEYFGTAIHDRDFILIDFNQGIVNTKSCKAGHEVLYCGNNGAIASQNRGKAGVDHQFEQRRDCLGPRLINTLKLNSVIFCCRSDGQVDLFS